MLRFGTAGIPLSTPKHEIVAGVEHVRRLGLDALEIEFVQSVNMKEEKASLVCEAARKFDIGLSVHAPYYINLNSQEEKIVVASMERIFKASRIGHICGAKTIVFHAGFYGKEKGKAFQNIKNNLLSIRDRLREEGIGVRLGLETTGKASQFGSLEELLNLSGLPGIVPVLDFSHVHARGNGCLKKKEDIETILRAVEKKNRGLLRDLHMHLSGIAYSPKGERHHLNLKEGDFSWRNLVEVLHSRKVSGTIISESPNIEGDALLLKNYYLKLRNKSMVNPRRKASPPSQKKRKMERDMPESTEMLLLVDENDNVLGKETKEKCHDGRGLLHRAFMLVVVKGGKVLLTKRSPKKRLWPGFWDGSVSSHVHEGESYGESARKRMWEELGMDCGGMEYLFKFTYQVPYKDMGAEHEICAVLLAETEGEPKPSPDEISSLKFMDMEEFRKEMKESGNKYCPWLKLAWDRIEKRGTVLLHKHGV